MNQVEQLSPPLKKHRAPLLRAHKTVLVRLIASLFVAIALLVAPLATPNAVAMAQMSECSVPATAGACPAMDDGSKICTLTLCVSVCAPFFLPSVAHGQPFHAPATKMVGGPPSRLTGIPPETEIRPPRPCSEI